MSARVGGRFSRASPIRNIMRTRPLMFCATDRKRERERVAFFPRIKHFSCHRGDEKRATQINFDTRRVCEIKREVRKLLIIKTHS